ncbi:unnamed protein product [Moneuplotes crassus]|uniref:Uncharacterized protein n=1 Tax=Euplotes crassus TaxID=5936 RepID=A0AAD1XEZ0_EUPCR|nr:unnamed protein product [Moneuplotes crassus]
MIKIPQNSKKNSLFSPKRTLLFSPQPRRKISNRYFARNSSTRRKLLDYCGMEAAGGSGRSKLAMGGVCQQEIVCGKLREVPKDSTYARKPLNQKIDYFYSSIEADSHLNSTSSASTYYTTKPEDQNQEYICGLGDERNWSLIAKKILSNDCQDYNHFMQNFNKKAPVFPSDLSTQKSRLSNQELKEGLSLKYLMDQLHAKLSLKNKKLAQIGPDDSENSNLLMPVLIRPSRTHVTEDSADEYERCITHIRDYLKLNKSKKKRLTRRKGKKYILRGRSKNRIVYEISRGEVRRKVLQKRVLSES